MFITCLKQYAVSDDYSTNVVISDFNCIKIDWKHLSPQVTILVGITVGNYTNGYRKMTNWLPRK